MSGKLRIYKEKLEGYKRFYSIIKTIKMVTMAKYRQTIVRVKTRDASMRYTEKAFGGDFDEEATIKAAQKALLYVPITTNRGSCGALNSNLYKYIDSVLGKNTQIMTIGKKGNDSITKLFPAEYRHTVMNDMKQAMHFGFASFVYENAASIKDVERTQVVFTRYVSAAAQRQACFNLPPYEKWVEDVNTWASTDVAKDKYSFANAILNMEEEVIRDFYDFHSTLVYLNAVCENELSEYAARIVAVEGQLSNIQQLQHKTAHLYNKTRQGSITAALIEIISAIGAMEGNAQKGVQRPKFWESAKV